MRSSTTPPQSSSSQAKTDRKAKQAEAAEKRKAKAAEESAPKGNKEQLTADHTAATRRAARRCRRCGTILPRWRCQSDNTKDSRKAHKADTAK